MIIDLFENEVVFYLDYIDFAIQKCGKMIVYTETYSTKFNSYAEFIGELNKAVKIAEEHFSDNSGQ